ncbi:MAG: hypothetical protein D6679_03045 [Candidatus Hydrogenedentota bacterium]|nr:MAG: hypothetical protein D6679_03045 [Candidatus Hydrogenedentota bacterium]
MTASCSLSTGERRTIEEERREGRLPRGGQHEGGGEKGEIGEREARRRVIEKEETGRGEKNEGLSEVRVWF